MNYRFLDTVLAAMQSLQVEYTGTSLIPEHARVAYSCI